jgi:hypothetical protein
MAQIPLAAREEEPTMTRMKRTQMLFAAAALLSLAACERGTSAREIDWAKQALARNPGYEIVATDEVAGVFTVRDTRTGAVSTVNVDDLMAAPRRARESADVAQTGAPGVTPADTAPAPPPATAPTLEPGAEAQSAPALADNQTTEEVHAPPAPGGPTLAQGPGYSISRGQQHAAATPPAPPKLEGPGYSITREESAAKAANANAERTAANVERRSDPIICQGDRLMRIDGETIEFTGDALIAEKGCDLYISNARIRAGGIGLIARQARVHIVNSTIGGSAASYEASEGAEIYVARSTFAGIGRRFDTASMTDLGGNSYSTR